MNPRIRLLADEANEWASKEESWKAHSQLFKEKFAELIVGECMKLNSKELSITAIERLLPLYAEHFGVEE